MDTLLRCFKCRLWLDPESFHRNSAAVTGRQSMCIECSKERNKGRARQAKTDNRTRHLKDSYGLTPEAYANKLFEQGGVCLICGGTNGDRNLCVDHDHNCCPGKKSCGACVRGLLCTSCNKDVAVVENRLDELMVYLDKFGGV